MYVDSFPVADSSITFHSPNRYFSNRTEEASELILKPLLPLIVAHLAFCRRRAPASIKTTNSFELFILAIKTLTLLTIWPVYFVVTELYG